MKQEQNTFNKDEKEKARRRLKYFDNFALLRPEQQVERNEIMSKYPDLSYVM
jgi:hypothetical protein